MIRRIVVFASILCSTAFADTVVPRDSVVNWVNVREEAVPGPNVLTVGHLHPGESAEFLSEVASYYEIRLDDGVVGFAHKSWTHRVAEPTSNIKIATFNIQIFGETKAGKPAIMAELASIIRKYDIVAVQEIKNVAQTVPTPFLNEINSDGSAYMFVLSARTGRQPDDSGGQEQYAYYLNTDTLRVIEDVGLFDDSANDLFQREPYVVRFGVKDGNFTFALITVHTKPDRAVAETKALNDVFIWAQGQFPGEDDFIALGDFNASCTYASPSDFVGSPIRDDYTWVVPDNADTNFSTISACAYDRIIITEGAEEDYADIFGVDTSITSSTVSDHFPVWAEFWTNSDN